MHYTLDDLDFKDKRVLVRLGSDVPLDSKGNIIDDSRIRLSIPTLRNILNQNPSKLILICHIGRPKNNEEKLKTNKVAIRVSKLLGEHVTKVEGWGEKGLPGDKIIFLENLRFNKAEKSKDEAKRDAFGQQLASLADYFVQDAFSICHSSHTSITSIPKFIPSCAGLVLEKEVLTINNALSDPQKPFVSIIGGLKADKLNAVHNMLEKVDKILIAGALAFTVLKGFGYDVGASKIDSEGLNEMKDLLNEIKNNDKVILPKDAVLADSFSNNAHAKIVPIDKIEDGWMALDIGPESVKQYSEILRNAKTVIWNGPIGVFEFERFAHGTKDIAKTLTEIDATVIVGGGDSGEAIHSLGYEDKLTYVSSGGGASLTMFEGKKLVGFEALEENYIKFN